MLPKREGQVPAGSPPVREQVKVHDKTPSSSGPARRPRRRSTHESTRRTLAYVIIGESVSMYAILLTALLINRFDASSFGEIVAALAGPQALAAAVAGFYFAKGGE
jgi:hypothetical protein